MIVTYTPDGADEQRWDWDPKSVRAVQAEAIEKRAGMLWDAFTASITQGSSRARRVLLWHLLKTDHPTLKLDDVDFALGELKVEYDATELCALRVNVAANDQLDDELRDRILHGLDADIAKHESSEAVVTLGKAPSKKGASASSG